MIVYKNVDMNGVLNININKLRFFCNDMVFNYFAFVHFSCAIFADVCVLMIKNYEINNNQIKIDVKIKNIIEALNANQNDEDMSLNFDNIVYKVFIKIDNGVFYGYYSLHPNETVDKQMKEFIDVKDIVINGILR